METIKIDGMTYHILRIRTVEEYLGNRVKKIELYKEAGIVKILALQRFYGEPIHQAFKYADGAVKWAF